MTGRPKEKRVRPVADRFALAFPGDPGSPDVQDVVVVESTGRLGPGGHPVYADRSRIIRAEISDRGEVRMLASGGHQRSRTPSAAERLPPPGLSPADLAQ
ncbi:DUF6296 family protein [Kitasatospora sp. NPDC101801]|uniref:DUF6296 family protein n=1 Tax=Kitasatospora sp. NPDC101801 TaxID=3364103 RepID=UPI0038197478